MDKQLTTILEMALIPSVIDLIIKNNQTNEISALNSFYNSKTYESLKDETTGVWHFSSLTIYNMFLSEQENGKITFPTEG